MECVTFGLVEIIAKIIGVNVKVPISSDKGCRFIEEAGEGIQDSSEEGNG